MTGVGYCRSCNHPIYWALTINGDRIPLDVEPSEHGTLRLEPGAEGQIAVYVPETDRPKYAGRLYLTHFATCPNAAQYRRRQKRRPEPDPGLRYVGD